MFGDGGMIFVIEEKKNREGEKENVCGLL